jgi:formylmethanofuran dehydrogenase subunit E
MRTIEEIGIVKSKFKESADPFEMRKHESTILIDKKYEEGLFRLEENRYIQVLFLFDRSADYTLIGPRYHGDVKGVFASRSPRRPCPIGSTTVELLSRTGTELRVRGLDALDATPVLDLKPYTPGLDDARQERAEKAEEDFIRRNPRGELIPLIKNREVKALLLASGRLHGHFCPGVSLGVQAAVSGLHRLAALKEQSVASVFAADGLEELLAVIEINSCFADGIQTVSGCTFGNNSLIYRDFGKTAVTFTDRTGKGIRVAVDLDYRSAIDEAAPRFGELFDAVVKEQQRKDALVAEFKKVSEEASFALLDIPEEQLFSFAEVAAEVPAYAPIVESVTCERCGERVMGSKIVEQSGREMCIPCAESSYLTVTGTGISESS